MVQRRPDLFAAYVGTGQVASWAAAVQIQFDLLLAKALAAKDEASIKMLEGIGRPNPNDAKQYFGFPKNLFAVMPPSDQAWLENLRAAAATHLVESAAIAYFDSVEAPQKKLVLIEGAGHFAFMTHAEQFWDVLVHAVDPAAIARGT